MNSMPPQNAVQTHRKLSRWIATGLTMAAVLAGACTSLPPWPPAGCAASLDTCRVTECLMEKQGNPLMLCALSHGHLDCTCSGITSGVRRREAG